MKKILFLLSMLLFSFKVNATTYYSKYSDYSDYFENNIESNELIEVEKVPFYQLYRENIEYTYLGESNFEKTGNTKLIETDWVDEIELLDQTKNIEKMYTYSYKLAKDYKYLVLENNSNRMISLDYLNIYDKLEDKYIYESPTIVLYPKDKFVININDLSNLATTKIEISTSGYDEKSENIVFSLFASLQQPNSSNGDLLERVEGNSDIASILIDDFSNYKIYNYNSLYATYDSNKELNGLGEPSIQYRNTYLLNEYRIINKEYIDKYSLNDIDDLKIDMNKIKYMYRYRKRDKVVIKDDLNIDSVDKKLTDFIEDSSIDNISITSNINYAINGTYKINFILPFKTITKDVVVDIKDNYINEINKQAEYITVLQDTTKESTYLTNKKNQEIKEVIVEEEQKIIALTDKLNGCYKEVKELKKQKEDLKEEKKMKEQSFSYIYIILVMIMLLVIYRIKGFKKNI